MGVHSYLPAISRSTSCFLLEGKPLRSQHHSANMEAPLVTPRAVCHFLFLPNTIVLSDRDRPVKLVTTSAGSLLHLFCLDLDGRVLIRPQSTHLEVKKFRLRRYDTNQPGAQTMMMLHDDLPTLYGRFEEGMIKICLGCSLHHPNILDARYNLLPPQKKKNTP